MAEKRLQDLSAAELRKAAVAKDWDEFCDARIARQQNRVKSLTRKVELKKNALQEAQKMLLEAQRDKQNGPPDGWKLPKPLEGGFNVTVPTTNMTARGN